MSIWTWVGDFRARARADGDRPRLRLTEIHEEAWPHRETNPDRMIVLFQEGRCLAESLREPWWELFFDFWRLDTLLHWKADYRDAKDLAIRNTLRARQPTFKGFPLNFCIHRDLATVYLGTDPVGYEAAIREALDYIEREVPPEGQDRYLLLSSRRALAVNLERYDEAVELALTALELMDADPCVTGHFAQNVYESLCWVAYRRGDRQSLAEWSALGEKAVFSAGQRLAVAEFVLWQALLARQERREADAQRLRRRAASCVRRMGMRCLGYYWEALSAFHEAGGELEKALRVRRDQLDSLNGRGLLDDECECRIHVCRLRAQMGSLTAEDVAAAREAAGKLRVPDRYLARLDDAMRGRRTGSA